MLLPVGAQLLCICIHRPGPAHGAADSLTAMAPPPDRCVLISGGGFRCGARLAAGNAAGGAPRRGWRRTWRAAHAPRRWPGSRGPGGDKLNRGSQSGPSVRAARSRLAPSLPARPAQARQALPPRPWTAADQSPCWPRCAPTRACSPSTPALTPRTACCSAPWAAPAPRMRRRRRPRRRPAHDVRRPRLPAPEQRRPERHGNGGPRARQPNQR
jgi:hypothetical protein